MKSESRSEKNPGSKFNLDIRHSIFDIRYSSGILLAVLALLFGAAVYLYGLDSIHIPNIGDEGPYMQICRKTAESGAWLPLRSERGVDNTKPPMLFWQGILTTNWAANWDPWHLRIPSVCYTLLVALLVGFTTFRISRDSVTAGLSGLIYLGFLSTIQQGRTYLVHPAETFFLFLPIVLLLRRERITPWLWIVCGLLLGIGALYKSFFLVFADCFALSLVFLGTRKWSLTNYFKRDFIPLFLMGLLGIGIFMIWPLLDPMPEMIYKQFIIGENVDKFQVGKFLQGLFSGPYTVFRIWLGDFINAGFYAPLLIGLLLMMVRKRNEAMPEEEKRLWLYVLGLLLVYTIPTQRQENYILPTCAAISVLMGVRLKGIPAKWVRLSLVLVLLFTIAVCWAQREIERALNTPLFSMKHYVIAGAICIVCIFSLIRVKYGRLLLPWLVLGLLLVSGMFLQPFSVPFKTETQSLMAGKEAWCPSNFNSSYEKYRFKFPGADIRSYGDKPDSVTNKAEYMIVMMNDESPGPAGFHAIDRVPNLRTRHTGKEMQDIIFHRHYELLVNWLTVFERNAIPTTAKSEF